jgi:tetratricopeptide (TPR) repeat protein
MNMTPSNPKVYRFLLAIPVVVLSACGSPEQQAQSSYDRGVALLEKKDDAGARIELLNALKYKSDKIEAWRALAGIDDRAKAAQALFQDLRRIVELDANDLEARVKLSKMLLGGGAPEAALKILNEANSSADENASFHAVKALILARQKETDNAVGEAQKAIAIDPGEIDAALLLSAEKLSRGDADGALRPLTVPSIESKDDFRVNLLKAQIFARKNDLSQAESILRRLIALKPQETFLRSQLIQILGAQRRFDEAETEMRLIAKENPTNSKAELDVVRLVSQSKGLAAGKEELESRIKEGGDVFPYQMALADFKFAQGQFLDSVALLESLIAAKDSPEHTLAAQIKLAELQLRQANVSAAEALVGDILKKDPRNITGLKIRATILIDRGQFESAIADLREALNGSPKSPELLLLMALAYEKDGKIELADRQYADAFKSSSGNAVVALRYVGFLQRQGKIAQAEDILTEAASRNSRNLEILGALAQIKLAQKNWTGVLAMADAVQKSGNDRGFAAQLRAAAFAGQGKTDLSIAALEEAHAYAPDVLPTVALLVNSYLRTGKADKSAALLSEMLKKFPQNVQLIEMMGQTQLVNNNFAEAESNFKAMTALQPKDAGGYRALADLYVRQKRYDEANKIIQEGLHEQPDDLYLQLALAGLLIVKGDNDGAIAKYEAILKVYPTLVVAKNNLASLLLDYRTDKNDLTGAYALAEGLKNSNVPEFEDTFGWAQYKKGDYTAALAALEDAQKKSPNVASIHYHLGMTYTATGQAEKAAAQLQDALRLEPEGSPLKDKIKSALK